MVIPDDIFTRLQPELLRQADRILDNPDYAKDVVQDVWLEVLTRTNIVNLDCYCFRSVRNKALRVLRSRKYTGELAPDPGYDPYSPTEELKALLLELPEPLQEMLELKYRCNYSDERVALVIGSSVSTIRRKLGHAKALLNQMMVA